MICAVVLSKEVNKFLFEEKKKEILCTLDAWVFYSCCAYYTFAN